jgi:hypothetical protein
MTPVLERLRPVRPIEAAGVFFGLVAAFHAFRVATFALRHTFFFGWGDDIGGFWLAKNLGFFKYLWSPIDVHRVPLLRLVSYFIYRLSPLRFEPAEAVLVISHVAGCLFLFAALQQIRRTPANCALVAWCAINPYLGSQLFWWTAGAARLPYIVFANAAAYGYLRYRAGGSHRWAAFVAGSTVLSLGFFAKGVLIPLNLAALEIVLRFGERSGSSGTSTRQKPGHSWALLGGLATLSALYVLAWRAATPANLREASWDPKFLSLYIGWTWKFFAIGTAGFLVDDSVRVARWVGAAWALMIVYSAVRSRGALAAWAAAFAVLSVSIFAGTSSARAQAAGPFMAVVGDRYYYELAPALVLFIGAAFRNFAWGGFEGAMVRRPWTRWTAAAAACAACAFTALARQSYLSTERLFETSYADFAGAKIYFENLRAGLQRTSRDSDGALPIVNSDIPRGLVFFVRQPRTTGQLLWLMGFSVKGTPPRPGAYWVTQKGHVYRL